MSHATFSAPDMTAYCGLEELGLVAVGMRCQGGGFVLKCRAANPVRLCPGCGRPGRVQLSVYPSSCLKGLMHDE